MITLSCSCGAWETAEVEFKVRPAERRMAFQHLVEQRDPKTNAVLLVPTLHHIEHKVEAHADAASRAGLLEEAEYARRIAAFKQAHHGRGHRVDVADGYVPEPTGDTPEPEESADGADRPVATEEATEGSGGH